jgi:hypothetical protein
MSSGEQEALRLADALLEYGRVLGPGQTGIHGAGAAMLRHLVAEREADRALMLEALEALEKEKRPWDQPVRDAAISKLRARVG